MNGLHDQRAERIVAGWLLNCEDAGSGADWQRVADITPQHFAADDVARAAFSAAATLHAAGKAVGEDSVAAALGARVKREDLELLTGWKDAQTSFYFADSVADLRALHRRRQIRDAAHLLALAAEEGRELDEFTAETLRVLTAPASGALALDAYRFDESNPPPHPRPIYTLDGKVIATPGNHGAINALPKAGKSAVVGAFAASTTGDGDTLGIGSENEEGHAVVHFDTEQSPADHHAVVATALRRTGAACPDWLRSYSLLQIPTAKRLDVLAAELERARKATGGVHSAILDGVADFIADPNDPAESFAAVERLHRLAADFDTAILSVLHVNPGSESGKTRGHLGSQLERKAETTLRLEKADDGTTTIWCERGRHCYIAKADGHRFKWDVGAGMHLSVGTAREERVAERTELLRRVALDVFTNPDGLKYGESVEAIKITANCSLRCAENYHRDMKRTGILVAVGGGRWGLAGYAVSPKAA